MENNSDNGSKTSRTYRRSWWVLVVALLIASGLFWTFGRTDDVSDSTDPTTASPTPFIAEPDQIENTMETDGDIPDTSLRTHSTAVQRDPGDTVDGK